MRFTVRRMMAVIFCLGVILHLTVTAWRVDSARGRHLHTAIIDMDPIPSNYFGMTQQPFWPSYWRALVGLAWKDQPLCSLNNKRLLLEMCEMANAEICKHSGPDSYSPIDTKAQTEFWVKLMRKKGRIIVYKDGIPWVKMPDRSSKRSTRPSKEPTEPGAIR